MRSAVTTAADVALMDAQREEYLADADLARAIENHFDGFISDRELLDRLAALRAFAKTRGEARLEREAELARENADADEGDMRADQEREDRHFGGVA